MDFQQGLITTIHEYGVTSDLLKELNLMPIFLRRYFEQKFISEIKVEKEEQILFIPLKHPVIP